MIYIVSGNPRSGTSLMMHILKTIGIPPYYCEKRETILLRRKIKLIHSNLLHSNPYYYEDSKCLQGKIEDLSVLDGHCVKIFVRGLFKNKKFNIENCKPIYMYRYNNIGQRSRNFKKKKELDKETRKEFPIDNFQECRISDFLVEFIYRFNGLIVEYDRLIEQPIENLERIKEYIGKEFDVNEVSKVIEPERRHRVRPDRIFKRVRNV